MPSTNLMRSGCLIALVWATSSAWAADLPVDARIDEVKVYSEGATVLRRAQLAIPAGTHRLIFRDLPATLDTDTLRITVGSREVRLGGIEVEKITDKEFVSAQERELRAQLEALTDKQTAIQDEVATAETQLKLLDSLATTPAGSPTRAAVDSTNLAGVLTTLSSSATSARAKIRDAKVRQRELAKDIAKANADLEKIATARKQTYEVRASIDATSAVSPTVSIEYSNGDAGWHWVYEARLDTNSKRVTLGRQASVSQYSGEDWKNAMLTLTTAQPAEDAMTPQVQSLFADLEESEPQHRFDARIAPAPVEMQQIVVTAQRREAGLVATDYLAEYKIPGRVTLDPDGEPRLYPVAEEQVAVELTARVIPSASRSAYLEALFKYEGEVPIQGGELQLYRDGAFVGTANMPPLLPGAEARIPFGADERIQVVVRDEAKQSGDKGVVSKQRIDEHKQRFEVTNYHSIAITVELVDRIPVAENKEVRIDTLKGATEPTEKELDGKAGVLLWRVATQPRQTAIVRHYYSVKYPADRELAMREEEE